MGNRKHVILSDSGLSKARLAKIADRQQQIAREHAEAFARPLIEGGKYAPDEKGRAEIHERVTGRCRWY